MSKELSTPQRDEALAKIEKALKHVFDICQGKEKWTMRVPARPDMDSDLIICDALEAARTALGPITQAAGESAESAVTDSGMESSRAGGRPADTPSESVSSESAIQAVLKEMAWGQDCRDDAIQLLRAIQNAAPQDAPGRKAGDGTGEAAETRQADGIGHSVTSGRRDLRAATADPGCDVRENPGTTPAGAAPAFTDKERDATPRVDAIACRYEGAMNENDAIEQYNDLLDLARQLERELEEAKDAEARTREKLEDLYEERTRSAGEGREPTKEQRQALNDLFTTMCSKLARGEEINWLAMPHEVWRALKEAGDYVPVARSASERRSVPNPCSVCGGPIFGSVIGTGDGSMKDGCSFAHPECYWRDRASRLERELASFSEQFGDTKRLDYIARSLHIDATDDQSVWGLFIPGSEPFISQPWDIRRLIDEAMALDEAKDASPDRKGPA